MTQITLRRGDAAEWTAANPLLAEGEAGLELDTGKLKFGDGVTQWSSLSYFAQNTHNHDASAIITGEFNASRIPLANATDRGGISASDFTKLQNVEHRQISTPSPTALPSTYGYGTTYFSIDGQSGWPNAYATVVTVRASSINPRGFQQLVRKETGGLAGETWMRVEYDGDTWSAWNQVYADNVPKLVTYNNSWTDFNSATYARLKATQVAPGVVSISGMPKGGTLSDGIGIATVPTAFRPTRDVYASCTVRNSAGTINAAGMAVVRRATDTYPGQIQVFGVTSSTTYLCLGFTYNIDAD